MDQLQEKKIKALSIHLEINEEELLEQVEVSEFDDSIFVLNDGKEEYLVCTDEEADEKAKEEILCSVYNFNSWFILEHTDLPIESEDMIEHFRTTKYEDSNETLLALIKDKNEFVSDAIDLDGRGHFLNTYDDEEHEVKVNEEIFFVYQLG